MEKFKQYFNLEKEEEWLNEMLGSGWELYDKTIKYKFEKTQNKHSIIKIDYRNFKSESDFEDYLTLFKDSGWEHIVGKKTSGKQYFKKSGERAGDDIFSDSFSKAGRYKKMANMWMTLGISYIPIAVTLVLTKSVDIKAMLNPRLLYYTPGLWHKTGLSFWRAFVFETPFVLGRGFIWLLIPLIAMLYIVFALKAEWYYKKIVSKENLD